MRHPNRDHEHLDALRAYYARHHHIPALQRVAELMGFASRGASFKLMDRLALHGYRQAHCAQRFRGALFGRGIDSCPNVGISCAHGSSFVCVVFNQYCSHNRTTNQAWQRQSPACFLYSLEIS